MGQLIERAGPTGAGRLVASVRPNRCTVPRPARLFLVARHRLRPDVLAVIAQEDSASVGNLLALRAGLALRFFKIGEFGAHAAVVPAALRTATAKGLLGHAQAP